VRNLRASRAVDVRRLCHKMCQAALMRNGGPLAWLALVGASLFVTACPKAEPDLAPAPEAPVQLIVSISSDPGHPVAGARVVFKTKKIATSDAAGVARVEVGGTEATRYRSPSSARRVTRHRKSRWSSAFVASHPAPRHRSSNRAAPRCFALCRRRPHGQRPDLPIFAAGVAPSPASTENGVAHFVLRVKPAEQIILTLGTGEKGAEALRPQKPHAPVRCQRSRRRRPSRAEVQGREEKSLRQSRPQTDPALNFDSPNRTAARLSYRASARAEREGLPRRLDHRRP